MSPEQFHASRRWRPPRAASRWSNGGTGRLGKIIPGTRRIEILHGARLFFPEERPDTLNALLRDHWRAAESVS